MNLINRVTDLRACRKEPFSALSVSVQAKLFKSLLDSSLPLNLAADNKIVFALLMFPLLRYHRIESGMSQKKHRQKMFGI